MTLAYMTKLYVAVFVEENSSKREQKRFDSMKKYMNPVSAFAIAASAVILPILGFLPNLVTDKVAVLVLDLCTLRENPMQFIILTLKI